MCCLQNNLKVFINGEYIAPCSQGYHNSHAETLLGVALEKMIGNRVISVWKVLCSMVTSILLEEGMVTFFTIPFSKFVLCIFHKPPSRKNWSTGVVSN